MGYRSEVDVVFYVPSESDTAYPLLKLWFDANYPHTEAKHDWGAEIKYLQEDRAITVYYNDVKWYEAYEHPQAVDKLFSEVDTMFDQLQAAALAADTDDVSQDPNVTPFEIAYEFVRMGEEDQDIEINQSINADNVIAVNRSTEITFTPRTETQGVTT
jgi:hypothetical protein